MDFSEASFVVELVFGVPTLGFVWLTWSSGYVRTLVRSSYRNRWGLSLLSESRWPPRRDTRDTGDEWG
jgi:hypothetical protein